MPKTLNQKNSLDPELQNLTKNLKNFSSNKQTKFFLSNFTNITERINQLNVLGIQNCEAEELYRFLLNENQNETINTTINNQILSGGNLFKIKII